MRKQLGGGMRQVGVLAAAGLVALETMIPRLAEDHAHARLLGARCGALPRRRVAPTATNIVVATLEAPPRARRGRRRPRRGVLATAMDAVTLRLVTHRDVCRADCERRGGADRAARLTVRAPPAIPPAWCHA